MGRDFTGKYVCTESTGFDNFMEEMGVPWLVRKGLELFSNGNPTLEIAVEGDTMIFDLENMSPSQEFLRRVTAGCAPFEHTDHMGYLLEGTCEWEGDNFTITLQPKSAGGKGYKCVRELTDAGGVVVTMIPNGVEEKKMRRHFARQA
mmetsp:Transcript_14982/g.28819  ORF Transcript_14982/g.28819 Transcript_14982/m.28819 type:complete len:147 (+) Transcript_14982:231-671(+)|eukprot:CAMPEP_0114256512 /NCGR_PEP_ID=MMETSP0058-20121206/18199_1 /TAXON_ID=36894 /ORGANISM="Pyramimonas parkeae, CCMP726" /LENGTH=146 /DNA_ID=CAMNT_0001371097 /DNA_START=195 /DNA_END=635 /DNA_ORIENTATION=+